ncbi:MAG: nicotinamide mononucleotide transporter [Bacteroidales bacterium]|nr:nicotinamide mononucleotide transporter [Bacteroidales bacterium]
MISWLSAHYVEVLGVFFSILYLYFSIRQNILLWPMGIISALLYMVVFYQSKFYADMGLNGYYFIISIYGWVLWKRGSSDSGTKLSIRRTSLKHALILLAITAVAFFGIGGILARYTDSPIPYWDAFTTAVSFTATWMLARKMLEHWILWILIDTISMGLYLYRGLYPTLVLFAIYTAMAVIGFIEWKKTYSSTEH